MQNKCARVLLAAAYVVLFLELCIPTFEPHGSVSHPARQAIGLVFALVNIACVIALRPRSIVLAVAALNAILGAAVIISGVVALVQGPRFDIQGLDSLVAMFFFCCIVPFVAAAFFFGSASRLTYVRADAP